ncbi:uncharacterized protein LOC117176468 [Belonocnema kinseyi]|uniref:uncharacterized protein LOC117176468 n=1 Tax=Belonocnema kinseyi TaxID=2817044 RepID=UPI00143CDF9E|nr:uncharacterized protein LOC117176468 [Belonocnema kinseyi]
MTKGGTDLFDQFCHRYSTTRKPYRWPLRVFYGMIDQSGVNSCALYNFNYVNERLPHRQFLIQLSAGLLEPFLRRRLTNVTLQRSLKACIISMLGIDVPPPQERSDQLPKRLRCHFCDTNLDKKTNTACIVCQVPICRHHRRSVCTSCSDIN